MEFKLQVTGMSCQHCVATVTRAVKAVDANAEVKIDLARGSVTIDSDAAESQLRDAIDDAGYEVAGRSA